MAGKTPTCFLGYHGDLLNNTSHQISIVFRQTDEVLAFLSTSNLTSRQNLCLLERSIPSSTASCIFENPAQYGGLQITLPLGVITQTLWTHLERCCQYDDGTKTLAEMEYKEALETFHYVDLLELQEELRLRRWRETMDNSFARACFLAAKLKIRVY